MIKFIKIGATPGSSYYLNVDEISVVHDGGGQGTVIFTRNESYSVKTPLFEVLEMLPVKLQEVAGVFIRVENIRRIKHDHDPHDPLTGSRVVVFFGMMSFSFYIDIADFMDRIDVSH